MLTRLNSLCETYDRTAPMGPFPTDPEADSVYTSKLMQSTEKGQLLTKAGNEDEDPTVRDQAIWSLVYSETKEKKSAELTDLLYSISTEANQAVLRRSGAWALFKTGETKLLAQSLRADDDGNIHSWKQHLIYESQGRTDWVDPRPIRAVDSELGFAMTLPLTIHGVVLFRTYSHEKGGQLKGSGSSILQPSPTSPYSVAASSSPPSYWAANPAAYNWHSLPAGPIAQRRLVGDLTASVGHGALYENLIIQKAVTDPLNDGRDHVQGYIFKGMSRVVGGNVFAHYYTSSGPQPYYLSGRIGDASEGVIEVETQLVRTAETHIASNKSLDYPYVQSVRGLFHGPARMDPIVASDPNVPIDNLLQIIKEPYANGWFFGEFRSVPVDVDGDGVVEINGMEMYTDLSGDVVNRTPVGPQQSLEFAR